MIDRRFIYIACAIVVTTMVCISEGARWTDAGGEDHLWSNPDSWLPVGMPGESDDVIIDNAGGFGPVIDDSVEARCNQLYMGDFKGPCNLDITGGSLTEAFLIISQSYQFQRMIDFPPDNSPGNPTPLQPNSYVFIYVHAEDSRALLYVSHPSTSY